MSVDVCYIISHGFAARMLLQTDLIVKLTEHGLNVAIVTPDTKDDNLKVFNNNTRVDLVPWNGKSTIWDDNYLHKRMYFLEDIDKNTALKEKFWNSLFFSNSKHPWKRIRPLYYYAIFKLIKLFPFIRNNFLDRESKYLESMEAQDILDNLAPKLVVSTYPVSIIEAKILSEARRKKLPTLLQLLSWDNISCKGRFPVLPEHFIVWGDVMKEELQEYYNVEEEKIAICGVPHFDEHIRVRNTSFYKKTVSDLGLDGELPFLFFAMSSPRFAPREIDIVEWLSEEIEKNTFGKKMQLIIRPHPQNVQSHMAKESWLSRLDVLKSKRVAIDYPSLVSSKLRWSMKKNDMTTLSGLISGCTICLNSGSTVSIDALLHHKPVILTSFDGKAKLPYWNSARRLADYPHLKKFIKLKGALPTYSYRDLEKAIGDNIKNPKSTIEDGKRALFAQCYKDDGKATERVVKSLVETINNIK